MEEGGPAGVDSTLTFENSDNMMELPVINYDQKQVSGGNSAHARMDVIFVEPC